MLRVIKRSAWPVLFSISTTPRDVSPGRGQGLQAPTPRAGRDDDPNGEGRQGFIALPFDLRVEMREQLNEPVKPIDEIVVPAQIGWTVVSPDYDDEENSECWSLWRAPVIAWFVRLYRRSTDETTFCDVTPVTPNGNLSDTQDFALQYHRGPFFTISEEFADEAALRVHFNHQGAMRRVFSTNKIARPDLAREKRSNA